MLKVLVNGDKHESPPSQQGSAVEVEGLKIDETLLQLSEYSLTLCGATIKFSDQGTEPHALKSCLIYYLGFFLRLKRCVMAEVA
jgi:hypothetical protein